MRFSSFCRLLLLIPLITTGLKAQTEFYRYKSDFSIKEKETGKEQGRLITGTVYYDKHQRKTLYDIRFPEPEKWLLQDTFLYRMKADTLLSKQTVPPVGEFSISA